jgi:esterase/lipase superfamily enzyme
MSFFSGFSACVRRAPRLVVALAAAAVLALSGCGEAPKLSKPPSGSEAQRDSKEAVPPSAMPPAETSGPATIPRSPYEQPGTPLEELERSSRDSAASQEVNRKLNEEFGRVGGGAGASRSAAPDTATGERPAKKKAARPAEERETESMSESGEAAAPPPPEPMNAPPVDAAAPDDFGVGERGAGGGAMEPRSYRYEAPAPAAAPPPPAAATAPAEDKNYDLVPVYYGTDRAVEADPKRLGYGSDRGHKLQLGQALVTVPQSHKVPDIERPWVIEIPYFKYKIYEEKEDPNKHFTLQEIKALSKAELLALVRERLAKSANFKDHAFVFVHGFNTSFDNALFRTAQIAYDLKFDGASFVYSWPSGGKVASYTYDRGSAEQAEPHLAEFLNMVVKESGAKSISLIAHSMGNELLLRVLERMRREVPDGVVISQVILAAPDVDRDKFDNIAREIANFAKGVTLYAASNDRALGYSARFWGGVPRAGDVPASGPLIVPGVDTIDVTSVSTESLGLNHSTYAENPALLEDIKALVMSGVRPPDKRESRIIKVESAGGVFWRFGPAN